MTTWVADDWFLLLLVIIRMVILYAYSGESSIGSARDAVITCFGGIAPLRHWPTADPGSFISSRRREER